MSMRTFVLSLTILNLATLPSPIAAQSCGCEVSDRKEAAFNQLLGRILTGDPLNPIQTLGGLNHGKDSSNP